MKRIAILTPGHLPVPAVRGGAVETLITYIIDSNETNYKYDIDLYTLFDKDIMHNHYNHTKIITIKDYLIVKIIFKIINTVFLLLHIDRLYSYYAIKNIAVLKKNQKYDKIIVENNMLIYGELFKRYDISSTKLFYHMHNVIYNEKGWQFLFDIIDRNSEKVIGVSDYIVNNFKSNVLGIAKAEVLYNCIDFNKYNELLNINKSQWRKEKGIIDNSYDFVFTGRCVKDKGIMELVKAFIKFSSIYKNCSLTICGVHMDNPNRFEREIISLAKNKNNIVLCNFTTKENLVKILSSSDCVVIPSLCDEAFGVVALEAMAMKKPIIATNAGGLIEPLNDECAIIIERENIEENLYDAMEKIYNDKKHAQILADNAFKRVHEIKEFNKDNYFTNFVDVIE